MPIEIPLNPKYLRKINKLHAKAMTGNQKEYLSCNINKVKLIRLINKYLPSYAMSSP